MTYSREMSRKRFVRAAVVIVVAYVFFSRILLPIRVIGISMEPTYRGNRPNFCLMLKYVFSEPERGDVVCIRWAGGRAAYLKRVVALEGDTVEFRQGRLFLNGDEVDETYTAKPCDWNMAPVTVRSGNVYVIGDNRAVSMYDHEFGQTSAGRIMGGPLW